MAIKISGTTVIDDSRNICNVQAVCATCFVGDGSGITNAPIGGGEIVCAATEYSLTSSNCRAVAVCYTSSPATGILNLPDATTVQTGSDVYTVYNKNATSAMVIKDTCGCFLASVEPYQTFDVSLYDGSSAQGGWIIETGSAPVSFVEGEKIAIDAVGFPPIPQSTTLCTLQLCYTCYECHECPGEYRCFVADHGNCCWYTQIIKPVCGSMCATLGPHGSLPSNDTGYCYMTMGSGGLLYWKPNNCNCGCCGCLACDRSLWALAINCDFTCCTETIFCQLADNGSWPALAIGNGTPWAYCRADKATIMFAHTINCCATTCDSGTGYLCCLCLTEHVWCVNTVTTAAPVFCTKWYCLSTAGENRNIYRVLFCCDSYASFRARVNDGADSCERENIGYYIQFTRSGCPTCLWDRVFYHYWGGNMDTPCYIRSCASGTSTPHPSSTSCGCLAELRFVAGIGFGVPRNGPSIGVNAKIFHCGAAGCHPSLSGSCCCCIAPMGCCLWYTSKCGSYNCVNRNFRFTCLTPTCFCVNCICTESCGLPNSSYFYLNYSVGDCFVFKQLTNFQRAPCISIYGTDGCTGWKPITCFSNVVGGTRCRYTYDKTLGNIEAQSREIGGGYRMLWVCNTPTCNMFWWPCTEDAWTNCFCASCGNIIPMALYTFGSSSVCAICQATAFYGACCTFEDLGFDTSCLTSPVDRCFFAIYGTTEECKCMCTYTAKGDSFRFNLTPGSTLCFDYVSANNNLSGANICCCNNHTCAYPIDGTNPVFFWRSECTRYCVSQTPVVDFWTVDYSSYPAQILDSCFCCDNGTVRPYFGDFDWVSGNYIQASNPYVCGSQIGLDGWIKTLTVTANGEITDQLSGSSSGSKIFGTVQPTTQSIAISGEWVKFYPTYRG